jgi:uncharacterized membrane protein
VWLPRLSNIDVVINAVGIIREKQGQSFKDLLIGWPLTQKWILLSLILYVFAGVCWLPVVWLQYKMRDMAQEAVTNGTPLPPLYYRYMRTWFFLGWPAFISLMIVFTLMVFKPI